MQRMKRSVRSLVHTLGLSPGSAIILYKIQLENKVDCYEIQQGD